MTMILFNTVLLLLGVLFLSLSITIIYNSHINSKQLEFNQSYMLSSLLIDIDAVTEMFDSLVTSCFIEYFIFNPIEEDTYINAEIEKEIITEISSKVISRMTTAMLSKLGLIYVINTEEQLSDIIATRVYIRVTDFIVEHNVPKL